ncbi:hypothetical protein LT330_001382 [Penicillium expansum]|nr:hypothetical protein LT330_001382 [Penicillium expansum]
MRLFGTAALVAALFATTVIAGMEELAAVLPSCALDCMMTSVSQSSCKTTNQTCLCNDAHYTAVLQKCVVTSCTIRESLTTKNVTTSACGAPIRDRTKIVSYAGVVGGIIALLAFFLRMLARLSCCGGMFGVDDWTMVLLIPLSALSVVLANSGLGKDMWTLPFDNITHILYCRPLPGAWHRWYGEENYKCNHINAQGWAAAVLNMVLDIIVMVLPLRQLYRLNLSVRRKAFAMCMFSLGIFVTLVSILRLNSLIHFASTTNLTWDYVTVGYWSTIECDVGVICACLPAIRSLLRRVAPGLFGDTEKAKSSYAMNSHSRGTGSQFAAVPVQGNSYDRQFYPLDEVDTSDEARIHHPHPV